MPAQIYTFEIVYADCENKLWRTAEVSSNYTLAKLGYMILATFDTMAYHLFSMKFKDIEYVLTQEDIDEEFYSFKTFKALKTKRTLLNKTKLSDLKFNSGDIIEMTYDFGCDQLFTIKFTAARDMPKGHGTKYPKIIDGAGHGILDDVPASELLEIIHQTEAGNPPDIIYPYEMNNHWNFEHYDVDIDNMRLKYSIEDIQEGYECFE